MAPIICQNPFSGVHLYYLLILGSHYDYDVTPRTQRERTRKTQRETERVRENRTV